MKRKGNLYRIFVIALLGLVIQMSHAGIEFNPDPNTNWIENAKTLEIGKNPRKGWNAHDPAQVSVELSTDHLRLREISKKGYGYLWRYILCDLRPKSGYRYLQFKLGEQENPKHYLYASNATSGGKAFGYLKSGITTCDLGVQPIWVKKVK